jgi:hypothetical protein
LASNGTRPCVRPSPPLVPPLTSFLVDGEDEAPRGCQYSAAASVRKAPGHGFVNRRVGEGQSGGLEISLKQYFHARRTPARQVVSGGRRTDYLRALHDYLIPPKRTTCRVLLGLLPDLRAKATDRPLRPRSWRSSASMRRPHTRPRGGPRRGLRRLCGQDVEGRQDRGHGPRFHAAPRPKLLVHPPPQLVGTKALASHQARPPQGPLPAIAPSPLARRPVTGPPRTKCGQPPPRRASHPWGWFRKTGGGGGDGKRRRRPTWAARLPCTSSD